MSTAVIRYQTTADHADENQRLIEKVFAELAAARPDGLSYRCLRLEDGVTFLHIVDAPGSTDALTTLPAFQEFQREFGTRVADGPDRSSATVVGSYSG